MRALTTKEQQQVDAKRKASPPSVYNSAGVSQPLGKDFEAWLILVSGSLKANILSWINTVKAAKPDEDWKALFSEAVATEQADLDRLLAKAAKDLSEFTNWRGDRGFRGFEDSSELSGMMGDLQSYGPAEDHAFLTLLRRLLTVASDRLTGSSSVSLTTRLDAWARALSSYL